MAPQNPKQDPGQSPGPHGQHPPPNQGSQQNYHQGGYHQHGNQHGNQHGSMNGISNGTPNTLPNGDPITIPDGFLTPGFPPGMTTFQAAAFRSVVEAYGPPSHYMVLVPRPPRPAGSASNGGASPEYRVIYARPPGELAETETSTNPEYFDEEWPGAPTQHELEGSDESRNNRDRMPRTRYFEPLRSGAPSIWQWHDGRRDGSSGGGPSQAGPSGGSST